MSLWGAAQSQKTLFSSGEGTCRTLWNLYSLTPKGKVFVLQYVALHEGHLVILDHDGLKQYLQDVALGTAGLMCLTQTQGV